MPLKPQASKKTKKQQSSKQKKQKPKAMMTTSLSLAPVSKGYNGSVQPARYKSGQYGKVILCHSELVGDIVGTDLFTVSSYNINAGLSSLFLWLSNIAANYESYKFKNLKFRYIPACSTNNNGNIYLSVDFDPTDPIPSTERQLSNYQDTKFCPPWKSETYDCKLNNLQKRSSYFVRLGPIESGENVSFFDTGNLIVATVGCSPITLGKLWVDYEVEFSTPELVLTGVGRALSAKFTGSDNYATVPVKVGNAPLTATVAAGVLTLTSSQPYSCVIGYLVNGTGLSTISVGGTSTETIRGQSVNGTATQINASMTVDFTAANQTFTLTITAPTSVGTSALRIGQYDVATNV